MGGPVLVPMLVPPAESFGAAPCGPPLPPMQPMGPGMPLGPPPPMAPGMLEAQMLHAPGAALGFPYGCTGFGSQTALPIQPCMEPELATGPFGTQPMMLPPPGASPDLAQFASPMPDPLEELTQPASFMANELAVGVTGPLQASAGPAPRLPSMGGGSGPLPMSMGQLSGAAAAAAAAEAAADAAFATMDRNHDGVITRGEVGDSVLGTLDSNHDGMVTRQELGEALASGRAALQPPPAAAASMPAGGSLGAHPPFAYGSQVNLPADAVAAAAAAAAASTGAPAAGALVGLDRQLAGYVGQPAGGQSAYNLPLQIDPQDPDVLYI